MWEDLLKQIYMLLNIDVCYVGVVRVGSVGLFANGIMLVSATECMIGLTERPQVTKFTFVSFPI